MAVSAEASTPRRPVSRRVKICVLVGILLVGAWIAHSVIQRRPTNSVTANGTIEATEVTISSKVPGRIIDLAVDEGSTVKKGQLLARLDSSELNAAMEQARAMLETAEARYAEALAGARPQQIDQAKAQLAAAEATFVGAQATVGNAREEYQRSLGLRGQVEASRARLNAAQAALDQAQESLRLVKEGARSEQIQQAEAAVAQAQADYEQSQREIKRARQLFAEGAISSQALEQRETLGDMSKGRLDQAKARLAELRAGARPQEIAQAEAIVEQAKANLAGARDAVSTSEEAYQRRTQARQALNAAEAGLRVALKQRDAADAQLRLALAGTRSEQIDQAKSQVAQAKAALAQAKATLTNTIIRSPVDGTVLTKPAEMGEMMTPGSPIVVVASLDEVWLRVYVPENLYGRIKLGQAGEVTVDSYPDEVFKGRVTEISSQAEFTPKNVQTKEERVTQVFGVKITLPNTDRRLKPGMPADGTIRFGR